MTSEAETATPATPAAAPSPPVRSTLGVLVTKLATFPLTLVTSILVARYLGPTDRGAYAFLLLPHAFYFPLATMGFGASILYLVSSGQYSASRVATTCIAVGATIGAVVAAALLMLWQFDLLGETARGIPDELVLSILLLLPLQGAFLMAQRLLLASSRYAQSNYLLLAMSTVSAVALMVLVVIAGLGLHGAVAAVVLTYVALGLAAGFLLWREFRPVFNFDRGFVADGLRYGYKAWAGEVTTRINLRLDQAILSFFPATMLGLYSVAVTVSEFLWNLPDSMSVVLFNRIAAEKRLETRAALTQRIHRTIVAVMAILAVALAAVSPWLVPLVFGEAYRPAVEPLIWLLPGTVALTTTKILVKFLAGSGMPGWSSAVTGIGGLIGAGFYLLLIPQFGILGAAVATSLGYGATAVLAIVLFRRAVKGQPLRLFRADRDDLRWLAAQVGLVLRRQPRQRASG